MHTAHAGQHDHMLKYSSRQGAVPCAFGALKYLSKEVWRGCSERAQ